jgi:type IV secretory pathway VirB6-like protein
MIKNLRHMALFFAVLWSLVLLPEHAMAQTASLTCNNGAVGSGKFFDDTAGTDGSACQFTGGLEHIFSTVICNFVQLLNKVLSSVYCGMQSLLQDTVGAVLTLYVGIFGAQMLMGMADANAREFLSRIMKIALIWIFVSDSTWAIQTAFHFFVLLSGNGVEWVMSAIPSPITSSSTPSTVASSLGINCYDATAASATGFMAAFTRLDVIICEAVTGPLVMVNSKLIGFFVVLCLLAPQIGILAISWLWLNLKVLVQGLVTFLLGIAAIAFLIALSPIFLSLMLFKATAGFFENWLKYMMSFSLQIILVFACIALWLTVTMYFLTFFSNMAATVFPAETIIVKGAEETVTSSWGVCPFDYYPDSTAAAAAAPPGTPPGPYVKCTTAGFDTANQADKNQVIPISKILWAADSGTAVCNIKDSSGANLPGAPANDCTKYLMYVIYHLITLIIISFAFEALLREAPRIAVYLSGPDYTPPLAGGFGISRAGQVRSLFSSSSDTSAATAKSSESSGSVLSKAWDSLVGSNKEPPPSGAASVAESSTATTPGSAQFRDQSSAPISDR